MDFHTTELEWLAQYEADQKAMISARKAEDHHTRCRDCGVFVDKRRWVKKDSVDAIRHQQRPLCAECWSEYD